MCDSGTRPIGGAAGNYFHHSARAFYFFHFIFGDFLCCLFFLYIQFGMCENVSSECVARNCVRMRCVCAEYTGELQRTKWNFFHDLSVVLCACVLRRGSDLGEYGQKEHSVEQPSRTELVRKSNLTLYQIQSRGTCFTLFSVCATYIAKTIEVISDFCGGLVVPRFWCQVQDRFAFTNLI